MAGASEQCMVSMAAGLASCGARPWAFSFAAFLCFRAYDQIRVCISQTGAPVTLVGSHSGGCGGRNGKTHLALNDIAVVASLPGIEVWAPASPGDVAFAAQMILQRSRPAYVRLPRVPLDGLPGPASKARWLAPRANVNVVSTGFGTHLALKVIERLSGLGVRVGLLHCALVRPLPREVVELALDTKLVVVEDHYKFGGLASLIRECGRGEMLSLGWPSSWPGKAGAEEQILASQGLGTEQISDAIFEYARA
jgi:transketolase